MHIIELKTDAEFEKIYPLIQQLNADMTRAQFDERLREMRAIGYRCIAAVKDDTYVGISGFWQGTRFWCGRFIDFDNVVVDEAHRGSQIGAQLITWVEEEAKRLGCEQVGLDCYTTHHQAHRFYFREGYIIKGYHFIKKLVKSSL